LGLVGLPFRCTGCHDLRGGPDRPSDVVVVAVRGKRTNPLLFAGSSSFSLRPGTTDSPCRSTGALSYGRALQDNGTLVCPFLVDFPCRSTGTRRNGWILQDNGFTHSLNGVGQFVGVQPGNEFPVHSTGSRPYSLLLQVMSPSAAQLELCLMAELCRVTASPGSTGPTGS